MSMKEVVLRAWRTLLVPIDAIRISARIYPKLGTIGRSSLVDPPPGFRCEGNHYQDDFVDDGKYSASWRDVLIQKANLILENRLSFFDLEEVSLGLPIDWQKDHSSDISAPVRQVMFTNYRNFDEVGDCKLVWEPNRHHQVVVLARAFKVSGDEKYAKKAIEIISDWIIKNPYGYGMNWKSGLEIGIRLINWIWAIDLIRDSGVVSRQAWMQVTEVIYLSVWDIQRKYSHGSSANNHLIGEAAGVFVACSYFPDFENFEKWRRVSEKLLENAIVTQTFSDGCTREHAFGYQLFVMQFFTQCALTASKIDKPLSDRFMSRLKQMYAFMADVCSDTGRPPNFGDTDDGYVLDLGDLPSDPRRLVSVGARLFSDPGLSSEERCESAYWMFGDCRLLCSRNSNMHSQPYDASGYFILRSQRTTRSYEEKVRVFVDCADLGFGNIAAHGHADCLGFVYSVNGEEILVDSGTYDYFTYPKWRDYFRSTQAHNCLTVDGHSQSEILGPFMWGQKARPTVLEWEDNELRSRLRAQHDGYERLPDPVTHSREFDLDKTSNVFVLTDRLKAQKRHNIVQYLHVAPGCSVTQESDDCARIRGRNADIAIVSGGRSFSIVRVSQDQHLGWISDGYHVKKPGTTLVYESEIVGDAKLETKIELK